MSKVRVNAFGITIDGYGAGPDQDLANPMGAGGMALHQWVLGTKTFQRMHADFAASLIGDEVAREGVDDDFAARAFENLGAWIMGRNMFGPVRGPWPDDSWNGWWGKNPPYHVPVFVLTHHARASITMEGGTTFHFVTDGIHAALKRAKEAAAGKDVRVGGGVATIREYLSAGLIDELHLVLSPALLGRGEQAIASIKHVPSLPAAPRRVTRLSSYPGGGGIRGERPRPLLCMGERSCERARVQTHAQRHSSRRKRTPTDLLTSARQLHPTPPPPPPSPPTAPSRVLR